MADLGFGIKNFRTEPFNKMLRGFYKAEAPYFLFNFVNFAAAPKMSLNSPLPIG